jgi:hypothetical protein
VPDTAPSPAAPILDDAAALHAVIPADVSGGDADRTVCDLPVAGHEIKFVTTLDRAADPRVGVNCLICLGWLGARLTEPPVVVKGSWFPHPPPTLPGESNEAYTDRLTGAAGMRYLREHGADADRLTFADVLTAQLPPEVTIPYDHTRYRQCSINYHDECSAPGTCECPCHRQPASEKPRSLAETVETITGPALEFEGDEYWPDLPPYAVLEIASNVADELHSAMEKFPGQHLPLGFGEEADGFVGGVMPYRAADIRDVFRNLTDHAADCGRLTWRHVLAEEQFEAFAEEDEAEARRELVQLAAMAFRAILDIDHPRPVYFTGPSGVRWIEVGRDVDGNPVVIRDVKQPLTPSAPGAATAIDATEAPNG